MDSPIIFLVDNGSLQPEATFVLRKTSEALSQRTGERVEPVSLLHSHKISADQLRGMPATIVKRRMRELMAEGQHEFIILPLFLGPSLAITDYLPSLVDELKEDNSDLRVRVAEPIAGADVEQPDIRLARILEEHFDALQCSKGKVKLALIDHGTPHKPVNTLRNAVAAQLANRLELPVQPCSMERREGSEYAFNDPLLENLASVEGFAGSRLILGMFFLLPGRHAGEGGDVAGIAEGLVQHGAFESIQMSPLLAEHPLLLDILSDRLSEVKRHQT